MAVMLQNNGYGFLQQRRKRRFSRMSSYCRRWYAKAIVMVLQSNDYGVIEEGLWILASAKIDAAFSNVVVLKGVVVL
jgi:hypothetical protein